MTTTRVAIDFNVSRRFGDMLKALYGHTGFDFIHLSALVREDTADTTWADVYKRFGGRVVISGDCKIAYKPHEAVAFLDNGFISFFPAEPWMRLRGHERAAYLVFWWPKIARTIRAASAAGCWRLPCIVRDRELRLSDCEPKALVIPDVVLARARAERQAG